MTLDQIRARAKEAVTTSPEKSDYLEDTTENNIKQLSRTPSKSSLKSKDKSERSKSLTPERSIRYKFYFLP